jgi:serine phosphatase RsbU (regulator of sigma subunit)
VAAGLASLHDYRSPGEIDSEMVVRLAGLLTGTSGALLVNLGDDNWCRVQGVFGRDCPWTVRQEVTPSSWQPDGGQQLPFSYQGDQLGLLQLSAPVADDLLPMVETILAHYSVALVHLTLDADAREATDHYCASLQTLEEGVVLFQESDPEAVMARLLGLTATMLQAQAGALFVLEEIGNAASGLRLQQVLGMPETLLLQLQRADGEAWPARLLDRPAMHVSREADPTLGGLVVAQLPAFLQNLVSMPLRYHGVVAGICVLFNVAPEAGTQRGIERLQSLSQLAAALLHRLSLEAASARSQSFARELEIAETIQKRLLPSKAPAVPGLDFAWRSVAAQKIGGDYLDVVSSDLGDIYALIADASGHGINSALLMSSFRSTWRAEAQWLEPDALAGDLNTEVYGDVGSTGMFITAATLRIEAGSRRTTLTSAGHNPVLLYHGSTGRLEQLESHGPPLGFEAGSRYGRTNFVLASGDVLLLYTDGISEATDRNLDMFGEDRLARLLCEHHAVPAAAILEVLLRALQQFTGRNSYDDDVSLLVIKVG